MKFFCKALKVLRIIILNGERLPRIMAYVLAKLVHYITIHFDPSLSYNFDKKELKKCRYLMVED
jgi:hypothetical protein